MSNFSTITTADDYVNYVFQISTRGVSEATSELVGVGHTIQNVLGNLAFKTAEYLTHTETLAMSFGLAAAASFTHATKSAIAFQQATASVEAISGQQLSGSYIGERAMAMSNQFGLAVSDMTQGLEALARAGITAESSLNQLLKSGVQMSKFEGRDLEESINDILSTTNLLNPDVDMNSSEYAQIVADLNQRIISTSESAPINAKNIMDTIQHVGGYASAANLDQEDLFATIAQLGAKGTRGELAGTALRAFVSAGQKDTAQRALSRIGLDVSDLWDESGEAMLPISEMKRVLDDALAANGYSAQQKLEFYSDFVGYKQANQIMKIDPSSIDIYKDKIDHAMSVTDKMNIILGTVQGTWSQIANTVSNFMTKVGGVLLPVINALLIPVKFIVQAIDAIPFGHVPVAAGLLLVAFKGIAVAVNNIIPTIASFMLNMDRTQENARGISGFVKETVKDLKQAKDILLSVRNPEAMAQHVRERTIKSTNKRMQKDLESAAIEEILRQQMGLQQKDGKIDYVWNTLSDQEKTYYMEMKRPDQSAIDAEVESIMAHYNLKYLTHLSDVYRQGPILAGDTEGNVQPIPKWAPAAEGWTGIETIGMDWEWLKKVLTDILGAVNGQNSNHDPWREPFGGNRPPSGSTASGGGSSTSGSSSGRSSSSGSSTSSSGGSSSGSSSRSSSSRSSSSSSGSSSRSSSSSGSSTSSSSGSSRSGGSSSSGGSSRSSGSSSRREHGEEIVNVLTSTFNLNAEIYNKLDTILSTLIECCGRKAEKVSQIPNNPPKISSDTHATEDTHKPSGGSTGGRKPSGGPTGGRKPSGSPTGGRKPSGSPTGGGKSSPPKIEQPSFSQGTTPPKQDIPDFDAQAQKLLASAINNAHIPALGKMSSDDLYKSLTPDKIRNISPEAINEAVAGYNKPVKGKDRPYPIKSIAKNTPIEEMEKEKSRVLGDLYDRTKNNKGGDKYFKQAGREANKTFQLEDEKGNPKYYKVNARLANSEKGAQKVASNIREKYKGDDEDFYNMIKRQPWASGAENQSTMGGSAQPSQSGNAHINDNIPNMTESEEVYVDTDATLTVDGQNQEKEKEANTMNVNVSGGSGASVNNTSSFNPNTNISPNVNTNLNANSAGSSQPTSTVQTTFNVNTQNNMHEATSSENSQKILSGVLGQGGSLSDASQTTLSAFANEEEEIEDNINVDATTHITAPSELENKDANNTNMNIHVSGGSGGKSGGSGDNSSMVINNNVSPNITTQMQMQKLDESATSLPTNDINVSMNMQNTANNSASFNNSQSLMNNVDNQSTLDDFQSSKPLLDIGLSQGDEGDMEIDMSDEIVLPNLTNTSSSDTSGGSGGSLTFEMGGNGANANQNTNINNNINVSTPSSNIPTSTLDNFMPNVPITPALQQAIRPPTSTPIPTKQTTLTGGMNTPVNNMNITMQDNVDNASAMSGLDVGGGTAIVPSAGSSLNIGGGMALNSGENEDIYLDTSAVVDIGPSFLGGTTQPSAKPKGNFTLNMKPDKSSAGGRRNISRSGGRSSISGFNRPLGRSSRGLSSTRPRSSMIPRSPNISTASNNKMNFAGHMPQLPDMNTPSLPNDNTGTNNSSKISVDVNGAKSTGNNTINHMVRVDDNNAANNNLIGSQNAQGLINPPYSRKPVEIVAGSSGLDTMTQQTDSNDAIDTEEEVEVEVEDTGDLLLNPNFNLSVGLDGMVVAPSGGSNKKMSCCEAILRYLDAILNALSSTQETITSSIEDVVKPLNDIVTKGVETSGKINDKPTDYDIALEARKHQWIQQKMIGLHGAENKEAEDRRIEQENEIRKVSHMKNMMEGLYGAETKETYDAIQERVPANKKENKEIFEGLWHAAQENYQTTPEYMREQKIRESYARAGDAYRGGIFGRIGSRISGAFTQDNFKDAKDKVNSGKKSLIDKLDAKLGPKLKDGDKELDIHRQIFGEKGREVQEKMNAASGIAQDLGLDRTAQVIDFGSNFIGGTQERFGKVMKLSKDAQNLSGHFEIFKGSKHAKSIQKVGGMVEKTLGKVATKFADFLPTLIEFLPVIAAVAAAAFIAVKALEWSAASHDAYVKKLKEEQKEYTARSQAEQQTYTSAKLRAVRGQFQNESQRTIANLQYELSTVRLEAANARRQATNLKLQTQEDDTLWGEYGLRATLQRNGLGDLVGAGQFESQADKYQGTSQKIREVKEYSMSWNPFDNVTQAERDVASFYDAHTMAFAEMDNYKQELGELYDFETKMMRVTGSQEAARNSMQFQLMLDKQAEKMGMVGEEDKILQYLDWMQTEQQVDTASQAMQAQADTMVGNAELKAMAISQGVTPEELQDISDPETREKILQAQADMIRQQAASQLWWQGVWSMLSAWMWEIATPFLLIVNILTAIWDTFANIGLIIAEAVWGVDNNWTQEDKDAIEGYHSRMKDREEFFTKNPAITEAQKSQTYFEASNELRNTDLSATGKSAVSEWDRGDFGNAPSGGFTGGVSGTYMNQGTMNKTTGTTYQSKTTSSSNNAKQTSSTSSSNNAQHTTNTSHNSQVTTHNQKTSQEDNKPKTLEEAVLSIEEMVRVIAQAMAPTAFLNNWGSNLFGKKSSIPDNALDNIFSKGGNNNVQYGSQAPITINEININTEDDPEKIKTALMNLIVELQEQVSPRIVSRSIGGQNGDTDTNTQTEDPKTTDKKTSPTI